MDVESGVILISNDKSLLDTDVICGFLSRSYWASNRPKETILRSIERSICFGAYLADRQIGQSMKTINIYLGF
jgi:hypothetical protein